MYSFVYILLYPFAGIPDAETRSRILEVLSSKLKLDGAIDFATLAHKTPG